MLIIDSNQFAMESMAKQSGKDSLLNYLQPEQYEVESLKTGDIAFSTFNDDLVGIEIKVYPQDFYASIRDNRLVNQFIRLVTEFNHSYLLCIGKPIGIDFSTGKVMYKFLKNNKPFFETRKRKPKSRQPSMLVRNVNAIEKPDNVVETNAIDVTEVQSKYSYHYINAHFLLRFETAGGHIRWAQDKQYAAAFILSLEQFFSKAQQTVEFNKPKLDLSSVGWHQTENKLALTLSTMGLSPRDSIFLSDQVETLANLLKLSIEDMARLKIVTGKSFGINKAMKLYSYIHYNDSSFLKKGLGG